MRVLITEEALQLGSGHWPSYIGDIAAGLRAMGDHIDVLVHRDATAAVLSRVGGTPWFSKNCWVDPSSQGALGGILHNLTFRRELAGWIKRHSPYDWICALTMRLQHLLAFALLSRLSRIPGKTRFFLLFVQGFGVYAGHGIRTAFPNSPSTWLARFCFHLMAPAVRSGKVILAAETKGMQDELQRFTGLPVTLAPHPVDFKSSRATSDEGRWQEGIEKHESDSRYISDLDLTSSASASVPSSKPSTLDARPSTAPLTITCPGFARHEKGTDLLQDAIREILSGPDADNFHFILQWPEPFAMPDGTMLGPDPRLLNDPRVEFLNRSLSSDEYEDLMERTDAIILPYRRSSYHNRVSRVAIEAAGRGIPLIYTEGTWIGEVAVMAGCGIPIQSESSDEIVKSLIKSIDPILSVKKHTIDVKSKVIKYYSVEMLKKSLINLN